jgi:polyisoprenoid-binding protein YceI
MKYPVAQVRVHSVAPQGVDAEGRETYAARFDIDLHGSQKTLEGVFAVVSRAPLRVEGELVMNRLDFGIGEPASRWNPMSIGEEIPISFGATLP